MTSSNAKQRPLSRQLITKSALRLIDERGLAALSLPTLAAELSVRAPSLYHHFQDKAAILADVARLIALSVNVPKLTDYGNWIEWQADLSNNFRKAVLQHRNAAPIFIDHMPRDILLGTTERTAQIMADAGVPVDMHLLIIDGCDRLTLGSILTEASTIPGNRTRTYTGSDPELHERLRDAAAAYEASAEQLFKDEIRVFVWGALHRDEAAGYALSGRPEPE